MRAPQLNCARPKYVQIDGLYRVQIYLDATRQDMNSLWTAVDVAAHIRPIGRTLYRVVESQAQVATSKLCDNLNEADILESLLETASKPALPRGTAHLHYPLATPWRYPPLLNGSRFGSVLEPSLFYGSLQIRTCRCECAYYRLRFYCDMAEQPRR